MPQLTLAGLRVTVEVAQRGSFTAAAEAMGYTQSAVSRQVSATESAMGTPLFEREARGVRPTPAGEALLRRARHVIAQLEAAELEIAGLRDRIAGRLAVGAFPTAAATLVPRAMARLRRAHPGLTVTLWEASSPAQIRRLRAGRMEVAVVATGDGLPDYDLTGLRAEPLDLGSGLGVAVSVDHPLASRDEVDVDDLVAEPWIVGAGGEGEPQFGAWPTLPAPRIVHEARSWQTRLGLVAAGLGVSVLPGLAADTVPTGVRWLRVRDPGLVPRRRAVLLTNIDRSAAATAMISAMHDEAAVARNRSRPRPGEGPGSEAPGRGPTRRTRRHPHGSGVPGATGRGPATPGDR